MAQTRTVTVEEIDERTSQQGKRYWRVKVAGERQALFCWDEGLVRGLVPGLTYQVTVNGSAEYPRITDVTLVTDAPEPPAPAAPAGDRERRMLRMSALRAAAEVLHGTGLPAEQVTAYAEQLLDWLES